jgi:hypothetical protein
MTTFIYLFKKNIYNYLSNLFSYIFINSCYYYSIFQLFIQNNIYKITFSNDLFIHYLHIFSNFYNIKELFNFYNNKIPYIQFIKDGKIIKQIYLNNNLYLRENELISKNEIIYSNDNFNFDFYIYNYISSKLENLERKEEKQDAMENIKLPLNKNNYCINKKIIYNNMSYPYNFNITNKFFINMILIIKNIEIEIILQNNNYNFYVEDNIFDINFFKHYLKFFKFENIFNEIEKNNCEFKINLIDNNINLIELNYKNNLQHFIDENNKVDYIQYNKKIILKKNEYIII